jgi:hypothetical protein
MGQKNSASMKSNNTDYVKAYRSWSSTVCIVTKVPPGSKRNHVSISWDVSSFHYSPNLLINTGIHPASYPMGTGIFFSLLGPAAGF